MYENETTLSNLTSAISLQVRNDTDVWRLISMKHLYVLKLRNIYMHSMT